MANSRGESDSRHFDGFDSPTTTPVPDVVFDEFLSWLGEAELKALLYIIRRTFGFKKNEDPISFNQFLRGITTRDGRILDHGCGVRSRTTLSGALKTLEAKGIIQSAKGVDERGENQTTVYSLRFRNQKVADQEASTAQHGDSRGGVVRNSYHRGTAGAPPVVRQTYPQQTEIQETVKQQTAVYSNGFEGEMSHQSDKGESFLKKRKFAKNKSSAPEPGIPLREKRTTPAQIGDVLRQQHGDRLLEGRSTASGGPSEVTNPSRGTESQVNGVEAPVRASRGLGRPPKATEQIMALVEQFSGEFHDDEHVKPNISHTARLWKQSGLSEDAFCSRLYEARSRTKQAPGIEKRAAGEAGKYGFRNKMPYFFACLEDVLGMRDDQAERSSTARA